MFNNKKWLHMFRILTKYKNPIVESKLHFNFKRGVWLSKVEFNSIKCILLKLGQKVVSVTFASSIINNYDIGYDVVCDITVS